MTKTSPHAASNPDADQVPLHERPEFTAWLTASCQRQGLPVTITDPIVIERIATLLGANPKARPPGSHAPHRSYPADVEAARSRGPRSDDGVIEHRFDDCLLAARCPSCPTARVADARCRPTPGHQWYRWQPRSLCAFRRCER